MNPRPLAALAALLLATTAAHAAGNESLAYSIGNCASFTDDNARLACYDQLAAQLKAGAVSGVPATQAAPPPQSMPPDEAQASLPPAQQAAAPQAQYSPPPAQQAAPPPAQYSQPPVPYTAAPPQYAPPPSQYAQQNYAPPPPVREKKPWYDPTGWFGDDSEDSDTENQTTPAQFGSENLPPPAQQPAPATQYQYPPAGTQPAAPPVQTAGQYPVSPPPTQAPAPYTTSVEPSAQTTPSQFGSENLPAPETATAATPRAIDSISAKVVDYAFNPYGRFTVFLDNGQVWQQLESDQPVHFSKGKKERRVTISRGALGSYNLAFDDHKQFHKVKRIK